jgi:hypothetical protein
VPDAFCANCDVPLRKGMIYLGWGLCKKCRALERRDWTALKSQGLSPKDRHTISSLILAGARREDEDT